MEQKELGRNQSTVERMTGKGKVLGLRRGYVVALAVLLISSVAAGGALLALSRGGPGPTASEPVGIDSTSTTQAGLAPDFTVRTADGSNFSLSAQSGQPVVLFFMTPNCPTCARMLPGLAKAKEEFSQKGLQVLGLNLFPQAYSLTEVVDYATSLGAGRLAWAQDENATIARAYGVQASGETVVIDRGRAIAGRFRSAVQYLALKDLVQRAAAR